MEEKNLRPDHQAILEIIKPQSSVLDLGCGDGELLFLLSKEKNIHGQGIEIDEGSIYKCVAKGLNVFHGDIDSGLSEYQDKSFDYVILNQSLQELRHIETVLQDALRVGKKVIVGFPNFAYYKARFQLFFYGRAPVTQALPYSWYNSPNIHFWSISDFMHYCRKENINIEQHVFLARNKKVLIFPNFFSELAIFLISKK